MFHIRRTLKLFWGRERKFGERIWERKEKIREQIKRGKGKE